MEMSPNATDMPGMSGDSTMDPDMPGMSGDSTMDPNMPGMSDDSTMDPNMPGMSGESTMDPDMPGMSGESTMDPNMPGMSGESTMDPDMPGMSGDSTMDPNMPGMSGDSTMDPNMPGMSGESTMDPDMPGMSGESTMDPDMPGMSGDPTMDPDMPGMSGDPTMDPDLNRSNSVEPVIGEDWPSPVDDSQIYRYILFDQLEYRAISNGEDTFNWDITSWVGGDYQRLWIKSEGEIGLENGEGEAEVQLLYGKLIAPFFDLQAGVRYDQVYSDAGGPGRAFGVVGIQGLAPYLFEVDAALFLSQEADISARLSAEYQLLLSQRLILQPNAAINVAAQTVEEFEVGSGLNDLELGLRLRYEVNRNFSPYVGASWTRRFGETADFARQSGGSVEDFAIVGGARLLF